MTLLRPSIFALASLFATSAFARTPQEIKKTGKLKICFTMWSSAQDGSDTRLGPDHDLALAFAKHLGVKAEMKRVMGYDLFAGKDGKIDTTSPEEPKLLADGTCDLLAANITVNEWRQKKVDIVTVYPGKTMVVIRQEDKDHYKVADDLGGKRTIVREETTYHTWVTEQNHGKYASNPIKATINRTGVVVKSLLDKDADFLLYDTLIALYMIERYDGKIRMAFPVGPNELLGWALRKSDKPLQKELTRWLAAEKQTSDGVMSKIFKDYFHVSIREYDEVVYATQAAGRTP